MPNIYEGQTHTMKQTYTVKQTNTVKQTHTVKQSHTVKLPKVSRNTGVQQAGE